MGIISDANINSVKMQFSDLIPTDSDTLWIPRSDLRVIPDEINLTANNPTYVDLSLKFPNMTGSYSGTISLSSVLGKLNTIPIEGTVYESVPWLAIGVVTLGIVAAFLIKYIKMRISSREDVLERLDQYEKEVLRAKSEGNLDENFSNALAEFRRALPLFKKGDFARSKIIVERSLEFIHSAKKPDPAKPQILLPDQIPDSDWFRNTIDEVRSNKAVLSTLKHSDSIIFY